MILFFSLMAPTSSCLSELLKRGECVGVSLSHLGDRKRNLLHILCTLAKPRHFEDVAFFLLSKGLSINAQDEDRSLESLGRHT